MKNTQGKSGSSSKRNDITSSSKHNNNSDSARIKNSNNNNTPRRSNNNKRWSSIKSDINPHATATAKEDSHKKHPKTNFINKAVVDKIKSLEPLCRPQKAFIIKASKSILKEKKKLTNHSDTINKLSNPEFVPRSIRNNLRITASKETMLKPEFIEVAQKYEQLNDTHIAEYKESALAAQVLDHDTMVSNFTRNFFTHSYDFCSASITKYISGELITRIYNDALTYQIAVTSMEIILEVFGNICVKEISAFFELDKEEFAKEVEQLLLEEYSKALELTTVVQDHCKIHSITCE